VIAMLLQALRRAILIALLPALAAAQSGTKGPVGIDTAPRTDDTEKVERHFVRIGIGMFGTAGTYRMEDLNRTIGQFTAIAREKWGAPQIRLNDIGDGLGFGAGVNAIFRDKVLVAVDYERVLGKSDVGGRLGSSLIEAPATAYLATLGYAIHSGAAVQFGVFGGMGRYKSDFSAEFVVRERLVEKITLEGDGIGQHYGIWTDAPILGRFRLFVMLGYRGAVVDDVQLGVEIPATPDPENPPPLDFPVDTQGMSLDWSGFMSRASMVWAFNL
jgi:hypothetical protein